jgi:hypothetical protein
MKKIGKLAALAALATVAVMTVPAGNASAATATASISTVPCNSGDYLQVWWHAGGESPKSRETCFANAGFYAWPAPESGSWLDAFSTGNNAVQYASNGRNQPDTPVGKYTYFSFPGHPGGVELEGMKIL